LSEDGNIRVSLSWGHKFRGNMKDHVFLTFYSHPYINVAASGRKFEYTSTDWPASMTRIFDVLDISANKTKPYALFTYDEQGRAKVSELVNRVEREEVVYLDHEGVRIVTNSLGKNTKYTFSLFAGVSRLQSISGEATSNCSETNVVFNYDALGRIGEKTKNGVKTKYQYDGLGREISRVEGGGTGDEVEVKTEWHEVFYKPIKITYPEKVVSISYDDNGQIKSHTVISID